MSAALIDAARELHAHGVNVVPVRDDGSKAPALRAWQTHTTTEDDLVQWFGGDHPRYRALGAVCGAVCGAPSGGLELLEIEGPHVGELEAVGRAAGTAGLLELWERVNGGWCEQSPSGGVHWLYRVQGMDVPGNTKLAADADRATIAETRGTGGQVVLAPTGGTAHGTGKPWTRLDGGPATIPTLTPGERDALHGLFRTLDRTPQRQTAPAPAMTAQRAEGPRPGDLWAARTTWAELLTPHGWQVHHTSGVETHWTRPGKPTTDGPSATTREDGGLYVFSTSTVFDPETPYSKFGAYTVLEHGGDHSAAARALAADGFTDRPEGPSAPTVYEAVTEAPEASADALPTGRRFTDGAAFIFDMPANPVPVWGRGDDVLWAEGEALMIYGGSGVGKTTLAGQIVRALILGGGDVLGLPVRPATGNVLYLAMDRPRQAGRSLARQFAPSDRKAVGERLIVWQGPPPEDMAVEPGLLVQMCREARASHVIVDSLKDAAVGLSDDRVGAGYNRARQDVLADGVQVLELHHQVKARPDGPKGIDSVYGSTWLTTGAGSVIHLDGQPGDPVVKLRHLKQPAAEVGPFDVIHDHGNGTSRVAGEVGPLEVLDARGGMLTARELAQVLTETERPKPAEVEKARRRLDGLVKTGALVSEVDRSQVSGKGVTVYRRTAP